MKAQNLLVVALLMAAVLLPHSANANCTNETETTASVNRCPSPSEGNPTLTKDVISITIKEIRASRKFVSEIPHLKSVKQHQITKEIRDCVTGLVDVFNDIYSVLKRVKHLKADFLQRDVNSLRNSVSRVLEFSRTCHLGRRDLDDIIVVLVDRKLMDVSLLVSKAADLVTRLKK